MKKRNLSVDLTSLRSIDHACVGCTDAEMCCCAKFDICVTEKEMEALVGIMPEAVKYCPWLTEDDGYRNVFAETDDGLYSIDTLENGLCVFAYKSYEWIRCAVHTVAYSFNIPLEQVKPSSCILWPLAISEPRADHVSICGDALLFHCNKLSGEKRERKISLGLLEAIGRIYGSDVREIVERSVLEGSELIDI